jgi:putative oxidoreductase
MKNLTVKNFVVHLRYKIKKYFFQLKTKRKIMGTITGLGRYLYAIPLIIFGAFHFLGAEAMAGMSPIGVAGVYISGVGMLAAGLSVFLGKFDKLAMVLVALLMLIYIVAVHFPGLGDAARAQMAQVSILKDLMLAGGALMYAHYAARDNSIIG